MRTGLIALALLAASPAVGQQPLPPPPPQDVLVIGRSPADREQQVRDFVRALSVSSGEGPMARFDTTAVCPAAVGLSDAHNREIAGRMRRIASAVGIRLAPPGCRPNVLVIMSRDKDRMIAELRKKYPVYFRHASGRPVSIARQHGPATAWHLEGLLDRDGVPVAVQRDDDYSIVEATDSPSRLTSAARPIFMASVLVIDIDSLSGLTSTQVGDYAAMRAFVRVDPARVKQAMAPTILNVLDAPMDSAVPLTLTQWDLSYLRGFYASAKYDAAARQRAQIQKRMMQDLEQKRPR